MTRMGSPAEELEHFLNYIDLCKAEYDYAYDSVNEEDRRLQDLLYEMEFAADRAERNRVATKLHNSRVRRRRNKDIVKRNAKVVEFFQDPASQKVLNRMRWLLGQQRKEEEYLNGERTYKPRVK